MKKVTTLVLMLCLVFSGAFCYAHGAARQENEKIPTFTMQTTYATTYNPLSLPRKPACDGKPSNTLWGIQIPKSSMNRLKLTLVRNSH